MGRVSAFSYFSLQLAGLELTFLLSFENNSQNVLLQTPKLYYGAIFSQSFMKPGRNVFTPLSVCRKSRNLWLYLCFLVLLSSPTSRYSGWRRDRPSSLCIPREKRSSAWNGRKTLNCLPQHPLLFSLPSSEPKSQSSILSLRSFDQSGLA